MVRKRHGKGRPPSRGSIRLERRRNNARRELEVVKDAVRLRRFSPSQTIEMMMDLSDFCVRIGRGRKYG